MVLTPPRSRLFVLLALGALLSLAACLHRESAKPATPRGSMVVSLVHRDANGEAIAVDEGFVKELRAKLVARGFNVLSMVEEEVAAPALLQTNSQADFALQLTTRASFNSSLEGRFRWTVQVDASLLGKSLGERARRIRFQAPAILNFPHEGAVESLAYAAMPVARELSQRIEDEVAEASVPRAQQAAVRAASMYFVMIDRFANGDRTNDEDADARDALAWHGGDLRGLIDHLDDIADLGVKTIWLSPLYESRDARFHGHAAFHGYWPWRFEALEPRFGDWDDLRELRAALDARGMELVIDTVLNHLGYEAPFVAEHPDWFHDQGNIENWENSEELVSKNVHGLPDLAQEKSEVFAYLTSISRQWLEHAGPDGLRLDAVKHASMAFWSRFNARMRKAQPGLRLVGEFYDGDPAKMAAAMREGGFSQLFDFPLYFAMRDVFCEGKSPARLAATFSLDRLYPDATALIPFVDNHDLPRLASVCGERADDALRFLLSSRGQPALQYGTEVGLAGAAEPDNRGDMRFERGPRYALIRELLAARSRFPSLAGGDYRPVLVDETSFVYARVKGDEASVVSYHGGSAARQVPLPSWLRGKVVFASPAQHVESREQDGAMQMTLVPMETQVQVRRGIGPAPDAEQARLRFVSQDGDEDSLLIVGSGPELGHWQVDNGLPMGKPLELPVGTTLLYKLVRRRAGQEPVWEEGDNRLLHITGDREESVSWRE